MIAHIILLRIKCRSINLILNLQMSQLFIINVEEKSD